MATAQGTIIAFAAVNHVYTQAYINGKGRLRGPSWTSSTRPEKAL